MRRILINDNVSRIAESYAENIFTNRNKKFEHPKDRLESLKRALHLAEGVSDLYEKYVDVVADNLDNKLLLCGKPSDMKALEQRLDEILTSEGGQAENVVTKKMKLPIFTKNKKMASRAFHEYVVEALRYEDTVRSGIVPYLHKLGIKTCIYCNAQYTVTVELDQKGKMQGRYELDHFKPKSRYPFLCINFYNLQPSCSSCNRIKSDKAVAFNLYTENPDDVESPFLFVIDSTKTELYHQGFHDVSIGFKDNPLHNEGIATGYDETLHITKLYACHKDVVLDLIKKCYYWNDTYKRTLINQIPQYVSMSTIDRLLYGFPTQPEEIHLRPLTKMQQDISKQLGLKL